MQSSKLKGGVCGGRQSPSPFITNIRARPITVAGDAYWPIQPGRGGRPKEILVDIVFPNRHAGGIGPPVRVLTPGPAVAPR